MPDQTQQDFLKDLEPENNGDVFEQPIVEPAKVDEEPKTPEEAPTNRRERRMEAKYRAERESSIALAAKLEVLTEAQKFSRAENPEMDETIARIYGTNTPEAAEATALLQKALKGAEDRATERALTAFREEQAQAQAEVAKEEQSLDAMIEDIEDTFDITLDPQTQKQFFSQLEKLSPKDRDGNVVAYADPYAVWETMQSQKKPADTRAKDLASRSMTKTGASGGASVEADANEKWLRDNGII